MGFDCVILSDIFPDRFWIRPIGPYRVAAALREQGFTVQVINGISDFETEELMAVLDRCIDSRTLFLGLSSTFYNRLPLTGFGRGGRRGNLENLEVCTQRLKARFPGLQVIIGGAAAPELGYLIADFHLTGFADTTLPRLARDLRERRVPAHRLEGAYRVIEGETPPSFRELATPYADSDVLLPGESLTLELSRGCRFRCKFCSYPLNGRRTGEYLKDPEVLFRELIDNYERAGVTKYVFADDTYNESLEKIELFLAVFRRLPFQLEFSAYLRLDLMNRHPEMAPLLLKSGLRGAFFGVESLNEQAARAIGKGIGGEEAVRALSAVRRQWGTDVLTTGAFILGLPGESEATLREWLDQVIEPEFPLDHVLLNPLSIRAPGPLDRWTSEFQRNAEAYGYRLNAEAPPPAGDYVVMDPWSDSPTGAPGASWRNDAMDSQRADALRKEYNVKYFFDRPIAYDSFRHLAIMGYGYTHDEARAFKINSGRDSRILEKKVSERISLYQARLRATPDPRA